MCGIAGVFHPGTPKPVESGRVLAMADTLAHRGPDGSGVWTAPGVGLGHRRLAIIDVAGSPQPMQDGDLTVTYNGEIYNFAEVRAELKAIRRPSGPKTGPELSYPPATMRRGAPPSTGTASSAVPRSTPCAKTIHRSSGE